MLEPPLKFKLKCMHQIVIRDRNMLDRIGLQGPTT